MNSDHTEMMRQMAFFFDASACSGCKTCQVACKDKNNSPMGVRWRRIYEVCGGEWVQQGKAWQPEIFSWFVSMACNHCLEPVCLKSCPNKAIIRNQNGLVLIDYDKCMGCRYCEWTCPYGALQFDRERRLMTKCHFCYDYLERDEAPACVTACPMRVIDFGELEELRERHGNENEVFPLPQNTFTDPALVLKPHRDTHRLKHYKAEIENMEEVK